MNVQVRLAHLFLEIFRALKNICIKTDGLRVKQEDVVTDDLSVKSHLSRALAAMFPNCEKKRVLCEHKQIYSFYSVKADVHMQYMINPIHYIHTLYYK